MAEPEQLDFLAWGKQAVANRAGKLAADAVFAQPEPFSRRELAPARPPAPAFTGDDLDDGDGLEVEVLIGVGEAVFVLTPSRARAIYWCGQAGHAGITPREVAALCKATTVRPIDRESVLKLAAIKQTFPGANVLEARGSK